MYMGARTESKAHAAIKEIEKDNPDADVNFLEIDLNNFKSVVAAAEKIKSQEEQLHGLVNNAGVMALPFHLTDDGFDVHWQVRCVDFIRRC